MVHAIARKIRAWENPVMIHESLRRLAYLTKVPEKLVGVGQEYVPQILVRKTANAGSVVVDPDRILESDLLRWLLMSGGDSERFSNIVKEYLEPEDFLVPICRKVYQQCLKKPDLLSLAISDGEIQDFLDDLSKKMINKERAEKHFLEVVQSILDRNWMRRCEDIRIKIISGQNSDEEASELLRQFSQAKKEKPKVSY